MELRLCKGGDESEVRVRFPAELDAVWSAIDELEQYSTLQGRGLAEGKGSSQSAGVNSRFHRTEE